VRSAVDFRAMGHRPYTASLAAFSRESSLISADWIIFLDPEA